MTRSARGCQLPGRQQACSLSTFKWVRRWSDESLTIWLYTFWNMGGVFYSSVLFMQFLLVVAVQLSCVRLFATPETIACQASLPFTISRSLLKLACITLVMPSNHLILCRPLLLLPSIFPSIRVFSSESALCIRWPKYWSFSFNISPSNEYSGVGFFFLELTKTSSIYWSKIRNKQR